MATSILRSIDLLQTPAPAELPASFRNCEDEPIRIPGSIQRHGFLLLLDQDRSYVVAASENVGEFLGIPLSMIIGLGLDLALPQEVIAALNAFATEGGEAGSLTYLGSFAMCHSLYSVVTHTVGTELIVEFERQDRVVTPELTNQVLTNFVTRLSKITEQEELCRAVAKQVKDLTHFNRVLLYRFDELGHGTVLCEENDGALPNYLDLRFPASDIPEQARDLYVLNTIRVIPDANYEPSPLRSSASRNIKTLDLSMSLLRSVSPIHLQYMRNMGTLSSMSISIVCEGRLWGLISGHHAEPKTVPYLVRSACDLLAKLVSTQLMSLRAGVQLLETVRFHALQREVLTQMAAEKDHLKGMACHLGTLAQMTRSEGIALMIDGECTIHGQTPKIDLIRKLALWMNTNLDVDVFHTSHLSDHISWVRDIINVASGLLAVRISDVRPVYLMCFRPEVVRTLHWAGEPKTAFSQSMLDPRKSFESWQELVIGESRPWTEMEVESATEFRAAVVTIGLKRAEEAVKVGHSRFVELTRALPNLVWTADDDGRLTYVNQRWLDQGFVQHGLWFQQSRIMPSDQESCRTLWSRSVMENAPLECELHFRDSVDMAEQWSAVRAMPYLGADGQRDGWVGTCTDTTDRRKHELAVRLNDKLVLTGRMTSVIAHEINNPLQAISDILYILSQRLEGDPEAKAFLVMAESELLRISGITKQTLRWSTDSVQKAQVGLVADLIRSVLQLHAAKIKTREISVLIIGDKEASFFGRAGQLTQVLANLVSNAIQAVANGGQIWLSASYNDDNVEISVRDDGHGMSEETQRNIFEPFFSTKGDLGNGLGLYISKEIVESHGGRLLVSSEVGVGTRFHFNLPVGTA